MMPRLSGLWAAVTCAALAACATQSPGSVIESHLEPAAAASSSVGQREGAGAERGSEGAGRQPEELLAEAAPTPTGGALEEVQDVDLLATIPPPSRPRKRMNIDQLDAALRRVAGGIGWTAGYGLDGKNELETLAATLGKPNYTDLTNEDLEPSALFQKFLGDAATSVCTKLLFVEWAAKPADRVFLVGVEPTQSYSDAPAAVDANLRRQLLRFHGRVVPEGSAELARWRFLFEGATKITGKPAEGWRAVCVALIEHPAFTTY